MFCRLRPAKRCVEIAGCVCGSFIPRMLMKHLLISLEFGPNPASATLNQHHWRRSLVVNLKLVWYDVIGLVERIT
jgi:hypothetical protein